MTAGAAFVVDIGLEGLHLALGLLHLVGYLLVVEARAGALFFL